MFALMSSWTGD